jgi:hypothetical protein
MNSELTSGISILSKVAAVCAGENGTPSFPNKVVPIGKSVAVNIGKIVDGQMALLLATV